MTRFQLAKLISWAGTLRSRKRLQKVVSMLLAAGCPLEVDFRLHQFGPYSDDVAHLADDMVQVELLVEVEKPNVRIGSTFDYRLSEKAEKALSDFEATPEGKKQVAALEKYERQAKLLLGADLKDLEHAATIAYFRHSGMKWPQAIEAGRNFKKLQKSSAALRRAEALAREVVS